MIHVPPPDHDDDTLESLLCDALDTAADDPVRVRLMTMLCMLKADDDHAAALDQLRNEGLPRVFKL